MIKKKTSLLVYTKKIILIDLFYKEYSLLIEKSKQEVISQAKSTVNLLFWQIGKRVNDEILNNKRDEYGEQIISNLAEKLSSEYGRSYELRNLRRMMQFAGEFTDKKIVSTLSTQLTWSYIIRLLPIHSLEIPNAL